MIRIVSARELYRAPFSRAAIPSPSQETGYTRSPEAARTVNDATHSRIVNFLLGIADDALHYVYEPTAFRDVVLPFVVLRRLDALLEGSKQAVLEMRANLDRVGIQNQDQALRQASGHAFYNTSPFTLRDLRSRSTQQSLRADFEAYVAGFSPNVLDILQNFDRPLQIPRLSETTRWARSSRSCSGASTSRTMPPPGSSGRRGTPSS